MNKKRKGKSMNDDVNVQAQTQQEQAAQQVSPVAQTGDVQVSEDGKTQTKQIGKYTVSVVREKCISAGSCEAVAPGVFALDEEGIATVISQDGNSDEEKLLAAQSCPTNAIVVIDNETGEQVWPKA